MLATVLFVLAAASVPGGLAPSTPEPAPPAVRMPAGGAYCPTPVPGPTPGSFT